MKKNEKIGYNPIILASYFHITNVRQLAKCSENMKEEATDLGNRLDNIGTKMAPQIS